MDSSKANQTTNSKKEATEDVKTDDLGSNNTTNNTPTPPTDLEDSLRTVVIVDQKEENELTSSVVAEKEWIEPEPVKPVQAEAEKKIGSAEKEEVEPVQIVEPVEPETEERTRNQKPEEALAEVAEITGEKCTQDKHVNGVKDENGFVYYKCRFCGLTFNFMTTLKAHERVHDVMQPYLCNKCGEAFHFMCELEYHAKQHLKQKGYKCDCGRTFYQYTDLLYHRHPGEDGEPVAVPMPAEPAPPVIPLPSMPAIDPASFPTPDFMEKGYEPKHPMRVYSDIRSKPYICQYCSKSYSDSRGLANHMYSHRGERMFNPRSSRYLMCRNENSYMSPGADV